MTNTQLAQPWRTGRSEATNPSSYATRDRKIDASPVAQGLQYYIESTSHNAQSQGTGSVWLTLRDEDIYSVLNSDPRYDLASQTILPF